MGIKPQGKQLDALTKMISQPAAHCLGMTAAPTTLKGTQVYTIR